MERVNPAEYEVPFFREYGFQRKLGRRCREYFWTLNPEFDEPQDTPCVEYRFEEIKSRPSMSVGEARRLFLGFFEKRGHTIVKPRPVVARWRDDLYLTIASIVVFQPHVTSGLVPPPANPLAISQPSIRLEDIDNVGITIGRHLTSFEMAAHHAFNYPDKFIYWKDETVRLAFEFFTREMGIPAEEIVFKESWWEGGGNAGPSFEVVVGGIELATLVFMKYRITENGYEEIPLKIVDTGYGVERLAWFTQKTPTAFHAIYGRLLPKYRSLLGIEEPDENLLWAAFKEAGRLDPEDPASLEAYYRSVAARIGMDAGEVRRILEREARVYSVLDHAKTVALMLADGIVPSNTGEGYLARLVARRALKQLKLLGANVRFSELVELQIEYWGRDFPQMIENRDYIIDAVSLEEERFKDVVRKGSKLVRKLLKKKKNITLEDLVVLYDSHGLPPEIIVEEARKLGLQIKVPHNFYSIVAQRHQAPSKVRSVSEKADLPEEIIEWAKTLPSTEPLYYRDPYGKSFTAHVIASRGEYLVVNRTFFYPTGGGQLHDTGIIKCDGEEYRVVKVEKVGDVIVHVLDRPFNCNGETVEGRIDWRRRYRLMRHHTATHVLIGTLRRLFGPHVWQAGAEKTPEKARLDFTHHRPLTREDITRIEAIANGIVDDRRSVRAFEIPRNEAEEKYGFSIYQGGVPMKPIIRLVEIEDWDIEGCGGTHLANTGEIGGIKILSASKIQDGIIRLEYVAGTRTAEYAGELEDTLDRIASLVGSGRSQVAQRVEKLVEAREGLEEALKRYRRLWIEWTVRKLEESGRPLLLEAPEPDRKSIQDLLRELTKRVPTAVIGLYYHLDGDTIQLEIAAGGKAGIPHLGRIAREIALKHGGKGGGSATYASLRLPGRELEGFWRDLVEALETRKQ